MDTFARAYIEAALWSSTDNADDTGGEPLDANYSADDIAPNTLAKMGSDCAKFQADNAALIERAYDMGYAQGHYDDARAGHDFWLTRNGHGAGFWDRGLGEIGDKLSDAARAFGGVDLYVGDDGKIYA